MAAMGILEGLVEKLPRPTGSVSQTMIEKNAK